MLLKSSIRQTEAIERAGTEILDHDVCGVAKRARRIEIFLVLQVEEFEHVRVGYCLVT